MPPVVQAPHLQCDCEAVIDLRGFRVGDSVRCPHCNALEIITRTKVRGSLPPAVQAGGLTPIERKEVWEALHRIKMRRVGRAARNVELYPSWLILICGVQFYLSAVLTAYNLSATGKSGSNRGMMVLGILAYLVVVSGLVSTGLSIGSTFPTPVAITGLLFFPLVFGAYYTWKQHAPCSAARQAGARNASVILPLLIGIVLATAQGFAVWFLKLQIDKYY